LKRHFKDANWAINKRYSLPDMMTKEILFAEKRLIDKGGLVTNSKIIADQTLGFWTGQLEKSNFKNSRVARFKHLDICQKIRTEQT